MKILLTSIFLGLLVGCSSVANLTKEVIYAENEIASGKVAQTIFKVDLTPTEEQIVTHALASVTRFRASYGSFMDQPTTLLSFNEENLLKDYQELRKRYLEVESIVKKNFGYYHPETQDKLRGYAIRAKALDKAAHALMEEKKYRAFISSVLKMGYTTVQMIGALK